MLFVQRGLLAPCIKQIQGQENSPRTQILEDKRTVWFGGCSPHSAHQRENISVTTRNGGIAGIVVHFYSCISWLPQTRAHTHTHSLSLSHTYLHRLDLRLRRMRRPFPIKEALLYQGSPPLSRRLCHLTRLKNCLRLRRPCRKSRGPSPAHFHNIYIYVYHFHYIYIYIYIASSVHTYMCVCVCVYTYMYNAVSRALRIFIHGCM